MKALDRYLFQNSISFFFLALFGFVCVIVIQQSIVITEWAMNKGIGAKDVARLVFYLLPSILQIIIPSLSLFSIVLLLGIMSSESELVVISSAGISPYRIARPLFWFSGFSFFLSFFFSSFLSPLGIYKYEKLRYKLIDAKTQQALPAQQFSEFLPSTIFYAEKNTQTGLENLIVYQENAPFIMGNETKAQLTIFAKKAKMITDQNKMLSFLEMEDATMLWHNREEKMDYYTELKNAKILIKLEKGEFLKKFDIKIKLSKIQELLNEKVNLKTKFQKTPDHKKKNKIKKQLIDLTIELHSRFAFPISCILLLLWAIPLGIQPPRASKTKVIVQSGLAGVAYYYLNVLAKAVALKGLLNPAVSIWLPNCFIALTGIWAFLRKAESKPFVPLIRRKRVLMENEGNR